MRVRISMGDEDGEVTEGDGEEEKKKERMREEKGEG